MSAKPVNPVETADVTFTKSRAHAAKIESILDGAEIIRNPHSDVEDFLDAKGREWARLMYEEHLALRSALEKRTELVGADGVERKATRDSERHLETVFGSRTGPALGVSSAGAPGLAARPDRPFASRAARLVHRGRRG